MGSGRRIDHLGGHAHAVARLAHAAFEHIADAELAADLLHVDGAVLVNQGGVSRDDEQPLDARKARDDVVDHPVGEIVLSRIAAQIGEGQDRHGGLLGQCQRGSAPVRRLRIGAIGGDGGTDIAVAAARQCFDPAPGASLVTEHAA